MCSSKPKAPKGGMVMFEPPRAADDAALDESTRRRLRASAGYSSTVATGARGLLVKPNIAAPALGAG